MFHLLRDLLIISTLQGLSRAGLNCPPDPLLACDPGWFPLPGTDKCVRKFHDMTDFATASQHCKDLPRGGGLVSTHSMEQYKFILDSFKEPKADPPGGVWIGFSDIQIPHTCASITKRTHNNNCSAALPYICQTTKKLPTCPSGWLELPNSFKCVKKNPNPLSFHDAWQGCRSLSPDADLVSIHSWEQNAFIQDNFIDMSNSEKGPWIGLNDLTKEARFEWTDNSPVNYTNWPNHPSTHQPKEEDCIRFDEENYYFWNDEECESKLASICQTGKIYE